MVSQVKNILIIIIGITSLYIIYKMYYGSLVEGLGSENPSECPSSPIIDCYNCQISKNKETTLEDIQAKCLDPNSPITPTEPVVCNNCNVGKYIITRNGTVFQITSNTKGVLNATNIETPRLNLDIVITNNTLIYIWGDGRRDDYPITSNVLVTPEGKVCFDTVSVDGSDHYIISSSINPLVPNSPITPTEPVDCNNCKANSYIITGNVGVFRITSNTNGVIKAENADTGILGFDMTITEQKITYNRPEGDKDYQISTNPPKYKDGKLCLFDIAGIEGPDVYIKCSLTNPLLVN